MSWKTSPFNVSRFTLYVLRFTLYVLLLSSCAPAVVVHNNAGNERYAQRAYDAAITEYRRAQVADPDRPEPYYNAANAFNRQGEITATLSQAQQALKTADDDLAAQTWYNLGNAYFDAEQWGAAINAYKEALRLRPDDMDAKHNLELALRKNEEANQRENEEANQRENEEANQREGEEANQREGEEANQREGEMTPEQARQLLQAIVGESQTLQERLQEIYRVPGPPPEEDW